MTMLEKVKGRSIGIIGMARSGVAVARLIKSRGGIPLVSDLKAADKLVHEINELKTFDIQFETGGHSERLLRSDFIIPSPGVPNDSEIMKKVTDMGIPLFSEIEVASWFCRGRIIAVTGSNGKTTTTSLIGAILETAGRNHVVCGNIGRAFSAAVDEVPEDGYAVVEVSSFQLEYIMDFKPHIALILNITPDHLDRYENFNAYKEAKYRITENQAPEDFLVINADDQVCSQDDLKTDARIIRFSIIREMPVGVFKRGETLIGIVDKKEYDIIRTKDIRIPGPHNLQNAAAASLAALLLGIEPEVMAETLRQFPGVEHRLEEVAILAGIRFVNDSKATNVDAVCYALKSFDSPICLIAGGRDKGGDFEPMIECGRKNIKEIILLGEARHKMFEAMGKIFPTQFAESMDDAVRKAFAAASPGEVVLLSPACASFDMYENYEHRGRDFKRAVMALRGMERVRRD